MTTQSQLAAANAATARTAAIMADPGTSLMQRYLAAHQEMTALPPQARTQADVEPEAA